MDAIRASAVVKQYGSTTAVDGVDLVVMPAEIRGLLGANGAGKTTLLRLLFGLIAPDAGRVQLLGRELAAGATAALHGVGGFVEDPCFYPHLSGRANLSLLARLDGQRHASSAVADALARVDLERRADDRVSGYSTGMRQRLGIAAALLRTPRALLLDEPTSGLDPAGARDVAALMSQLAGDGTAVLVSSHQIGELEKICHSYTVMRSGRVVWDGTAAQCESRSPIAAYALATSDDDRAAAIADEHARRGLRVQRPAQGGLRVAGRRDELDALVLALGDARVAIRRLELLVSPLESLFFAFTAGTAPEPLQDHALAEQVLSAA